MNIVLIYTIKEAESGRSIAAFLLDSGYSSRLVVHLRNTEGQFSPKRKNCFFQHSPSAERSVARPCHGEKNFRPDWSLFPWTSPSFLKTNMFS